MPDYRGIEQQFSETLGLERHPVAVKFQKTPPAGVPNFTGTEPLRLQLLAARRERADVLHGPR